MLNYTKKTKQGYQIIAKGRAGFFGTIIVGVREIGEHKNYFVATGYSEENGNWAQGHYTGRIITTLELFMNYIEYLDYINYKNEEA